MYKAASRSLVRRTAVDRPHPAKGYIDGPSDTRDVLPSVETLTLDEAKAEVSRLRHEVARAEQDIAVAKAAARTHDLAIAGQRKAAISARLSLVNKRVRLLDAGSEYERLCQAIREVVDRETADSIFARRNELRNQPSADAESASPAPSTLSIPARETVL